MNVASLYARSAGSSSRSTRVTTRLPTHAVGADVPVRRQRGREADVVDAQCRIALHVRADNSHDVSRAGRAAR
jgi:hypothetical protein